MGLETINSTCSSADNLVPATISSSNINITNGTATAIPAVYKIDATEVEATGTVDTSEETTEPIDDASTDFKKDDEKEVSDDKKDEQETSEDESTDDTDTEDSSDTKEDEEKKSKKYELLEQELNSLKDQYSILQKQYDELVAFKREIDNQQKDALIAEFYMLSGEDKADVIANKEKYSLAEIKAKLSVICYDKKVSFLPNTATSADNESKDETSFLVTANFANENENLPEWVREVKKTENNL